MDSAASFSLPNRIRRLAGVIAILLTTVLVTGCYRPNDDEITFMLSKKYDCKGLVVSDMVKTDSLPGIFTYVAQYNFLIKLKYGDDDALPFYKHLLKMVEVKGNDWQSGLFSPKLQDYLLDNCSENGQTVVEVMLEDVLKQLAENKQSIKLPVVTQLEGWAEMMVSGKEEGGWAMTINRDRFGDNIGYRATPVSRKELLSGTGKK